MKKSGRSGQSIRRSRDAHTLVYWVDDELREWYPQWQFDREMKVLPGVKRVLRLLDTEDYWHIMATLLVPASGLGDKTVLQLLLANRLAVVEQFLTRHRQ